VRNLQIFTPTKSNPCRELYLPIISECKIPILAIAFADGSPVIYLFRFNLNNLELTKIVIADSQALIHLGFNAMLSKFEAAEIVGNVYSRSAFLSTIEESNPDILIVDPFLPEFVDLEEIRDIRERYPQLNILAISSDIRTYRVYQAINEGIKGYISKICSPSEILSAINAVSNAERFFCKRTIDIVLSLEKNNQKGLPINQLTERETEILKLLIQGERTNEIADKLHLSYHTIVTHRKSILKKFGVKSSVELVLRALEIGFM